MDCHPNTFLRECALALLGVCAVWCGLTLPCAARTYGVGPDVEFTNIGDIPRESLATGDSVCIYWRPEAYHEKWVVCVRGTPEKPATISGVPGSDSQLPVIDGHNAVTRSVLGYWHEPRGGVKIGGASVPADVLPAHITIENLHIRSGRPPYTFEGRDGEGWHDKGAATIFLEKGEHITMRNCILKDCGNGFFCASQLSDVLIERCSIRGNGMENRIYEHNSYTEARGITFQYNDYGPLREGCRGNNLKDRSSGAVIRYNRIQDGNRQLDLVDNNHEAQLTELLLAVARSEALQPTSLIVSLTRWLPPTGQFYQRTTRPISF